MKKLLFITLLGLVAWSCNNSGSDQESITPDMVKNNATASSDSTKKSSEAPIMEFDTLVQGFGTITQGEKVTKMYRFQNTGNKELVITSARGSCGCTVPKYPRKPIGPGESGEIEVMFNSKGKVGRIHKKIYIVANTTPATNTLAITGDVVGPSK
ncbi:DUF1573 domain-containing protein [Salibacter sp.]|uniref:DUF1573 domain-containing protein n=1 Tax=Salibacter sp. TaxID=2010995 RepID=UPI002870A6E2|nr:DUF1573 domain-containing protein [Salibacter sp.]MDR9398463.1 DUF1573 domain-containing protein [Salibacter sp.]MDR9487501.1 DUF1573 domain-containing protein [Salibacter sp.]